jgi:hypothetical protein
MVEPLQTKLYSLSSVTTGVAALSSISTNAGKSLPLGVGLIFKL